jgi:hypothetical protein
MSLFGSSFALEDAKGLRRVMKQLNLPHDITAVYEEFPNGSEVNLFRHNDFLGRRWVPETGPALLMRLQLMTDLQVAHARQLTTA